MNKNLDKETIDFLVKSGLLNEKKLNSINKGGSSDVLVLEAFNRWADQLNNNVSEQTANSYGISVKYFLEWLYNVENVSKIDPNTILNTDQTTNITKWLDSLSGQGYKYSSLRRFKYSLNNFLEYVKQEYNVEITDINNIPVPSEAYEVEALKDDKICKIAEAAPDLRAKVIILFMYQTGMRRQELIDCKREHIDFDNLRVKIFNNGRLDRVGYFDENMKSLLCEYIIWWDNEIIEINEKRKKRSKEKGEAYREFIKSEFLFQTIKKEKISHNTILKAIKESAYNYFRKDALAQGLPENEADSIAQEQSNKINSETLRHSRRAYWFAIGKTIEQVQAIMGDENRWVCKRYMKVAQRLYPEMFVH